MCGRYTLFVDREEIEDRFDARFVDSYEPRYNMAPGQQLPVITNDTPDSIRRLEWGLVPSWADDPKKGSINARAETINKKPSFRSAYRHRRCLVIANGFYEWRETDGTKQPYRVAFEDDRPFAMAGLWEQWDPAAHETTTQTELAAFGTNDAEPTTDDVLETFTIVTTEPNEVVADLHDRMAAVLHPDDERRWLEETDPKSNLEPHSPDEMVAYPVSTAVNTPTTDDPSLVEPVDPSSISEPI